MSLSLSISKISAFCADMFKTERYRQGMLSRQRLYGIVSDSRDYRCIVVVPIKADSHIACRVHVVPMPFPCHAQPLIPTCHAAPLPCSDSTVSFVKVRVIAGNIRTASPAV